MMMKTHKHTEHVTQMQMLVLHIERGLENNISRLCVAKTTDRDLVVRQERRWFSWRRSQGWQRLLLRKRWHQQPIR